MISGFTQVQTYFILCLYLLLVNGVCGLQNYTAEVLHHLNSFTTFNNIGVDKVQKLYKLGFRFQRFLQHNQWSENPVTDDKYVILFICAFSLFSYLFILMKCISFFIHFLNHYH